MSSQYSTRRRRALHVGSQWYRGDGFLVRDLAARYGRGRVTKAMRALGIHAKHNDLLAVWEVQMLMVWVFTKAGGKLKL